MSNLPLKPVKKWSGKVILIFDRDHQKKWSKIRSRSWLRYIEKSDLRSDQKVILRSWSWSSDQDHCYTDQVKGFLGPSCCEKQVSNDNICPLTISKFA